MIEGRFVKLTVGGYGILVDAIVPEGTAVRVKRAGRRPEVRVLDYVLVTDHKAGCTLALATKSGRRAS